MRTSRAFALPVTLMTLSVVVVVAAGMVSIGAFGLQAARADGASERALYAAEAGAAYAVSQLYTDHAWSGPASDTLAPDSTWSATIDNNIDGVSALHTADGASVPPGCARVVSRGRVSGSTRAVQIVVARTADPQALPFMYAALGISGIVGSSADPSRIDAYSADPNVDPPAGANVATLSRVGASIALGRTLVTGQAFVGFKPASLDVSGTVEGGVTSLPQPMHFGAPETPYADPAPPDPGPNRIKGVIAPGSYRAVAVPPHQTLTLQGGDYFFTNGLKLEKNARLVLPAGSRARVYFDGVLDASQGTIVNNNALPASLLIAGTNDATRVDFDGGTLVLYAPTASVTLDGDLYGQVTAQALTLQPQASIHWDASLVNAPPDLGRIITYTRRSYDVVQ